MNTRRMTQLSLLTAMALIIFIVELRIPNIVPIPGVKLGLANIITVFAVYRFSAGETAMLVLSRIILGSVFSGNISSLIYSAAGAVFCLCGMLIIRRIVPQKYIWLTSVLGAILHNTGQIAASMLIMRTFSVIAYYPILLVSGIIAGFFTGMCAQMILNRKVSLSFDKIK
ncbi:MAG: Gx transporter family protein [Ruminococcus sp.]|nr:Gx transporter family protein [Ruminococcus sp.]